MAEQHLAGSPELIAKKRELARRAAEFLNGYFERNYIPHKATEVTDETGSLTSVDIRTTEGEQFGFIRVTDALGFSLDELIQNRSVHRKVGGWMRKMTAEWIKVDPDDCQKRRKPRRKQRAGHDGTLAKLPPHTHALGRSPKRGTQG